MRTKKIKRLLEKTMRYIEKYASLSVVTDDEEAIHQLRVGFKKLRAFIRLAKLGPTATKQLHISSQLKKMYKQAGALRNLQVYYHRIRSFYENAAIYPAKILVQIEQAKYPLFKTINHLPFHKTMKRMEEELPKSVSSKILRKFIRSNSKAIDKLWGTSMSDDDLHSLRKHLKDIMYNAQLFHSNIQKYLPIMGKMNKEELNKLIDILGEYHDWVACLFLLDAAGSDKALERIKKRWECEKCLLKRSMEVAPANAASVSGQTAGISKQTASTSGQTADASGQTAGSSGQTAGSSGQTASISKQTASVLGQTASSSGQTASISKQTASPSKQTASNISYNMIRKLKSGKYRIYSSKVDPKTNKRRNLGTFDSLEDAKKHEREIQYFKHH